MQDYKIVIGKVKKNVSLAEGIYEMVIETGTKANAEAEAYKAFIPGQFVNIYLDDKSMLLPRPISICDAGGGSVTVVYKAVGQGTKYLSAYHENQKIRLSTPLGNGYHIAEDYMGKRVALVAGGIGIPPMIGLAKTLKERNADVNVFVGFQSQMFLVDKLEKLCENIFIATDDGSFGFYGNVLELLKSKNDIYDEYFSCGPKAMLKALSGHTLEVERNVQVSIEERMGCGYGACVGCSCKIREGGVVLRKSVCKHGPVFPGKDVVWDE